ncbi:hypothetical protein ACIFUY_03815 [Streptomyces sp. CACIS-1.16CA]|uniref:hypothetical protein n=1 Tax=Streptomyces sp. CACIS-1.16CA TaxID=1175510 RepID=UPI0037D0EF70
MLSHVIPPPRGYTKASNSLVRHPRIGSDAKILVLYIQGLPEEDRDKPLSEHARAFRLAGRAYQKAKADLVTYGYVHEKREHLSNGRWRTVQVFSNEPLTEDQAARLRAGFPPTGTRTPAVPPCRMPGQLRLRTFRRSVSRLLGGSVVSYPRTKNRAKTLPTHPPKPLTRS